MKRLAVVLVGLLAGVEARGDEDGCKTCVDEQSQPEIYPAPPTLPMRTEPIPFNGAPQATTSLGDKRKYDLLLRGELGGVYTRALERSFGGARADLEVGRDFEHFSLGGRFGLEAGGTQSGLSYERISWGVGIDGKVGRARLGLEPRLGVLTIDRRSSREAMIAATAGLHAECIIALIGAERPTDRGHAALDLVLRVGYDWIEVDHGNAGADRSVAAKLGIGGRF